MGSGVARPRRKGIDSTVPPLPAVPLEGAVGRPTAANYALPDGPVRDRVRRSVMDRQLAAIKETLNGSAVSFAAAYLRRSAAILQAIDADQLAEAIALLEAARAGRRRVFICGNGGSAATASHFAAGLGKEGSAERTDRFRVLALTDNIAWLTSLANDTDYTRVFVEQLKNHAEPDDVLVAFSGSGNSHNVLRAVEWANARGLVTIGITGQSGGELGTLARHRISVGTDHMGHIEEGHFLVQHLITYYFMEAHPDAAGR